MSAGNRRAAAVEDRVAQVLCRHAAVHCSREVANYMAAVEDRVAQVDLPVGGVPGGGFVDISQLQTDISQL
jgi:hypothetical protein